MFFLLVSVSFSFAQDDHGYDVKMFLNQINREIDNITRSLNARGILYLEYSDTCLVRWLVDNLKFKNECKEYVKEIDRAYAEFSGYLDKIAKDWLEFVGDATLVAHNASFDCSFISKNCNDLGLKFEPTIVDTVPLCRFLYPELKSVTLKSAL